MTTAFENGAIVPSQGFDYAAIDGEESHENAAPLPLGPEAYEIAFGMIVALVRWAGGDPFRCAVIEKLMRRDERAVTEIARDVNLDRHKVRRAYEAGLSVADALRSESKRTLINKGSAGDFRAGAIGI
jgi:hypothetical protein